MTGQGKVLQDPRNASEFIKLGGGKGFTNERPYREEFDPILDGLVTDEQNSVLSLYAVHSE